jgi:transposase
MELGRQLCMGLAAQPIVLLIPMTRRVCFNYRLIPNMAEHKRNRKTIKRGRKRRFNAQVYKHRFCSERSFARIDKFRALLIRHDRKDVYF